MKLSQSSKELIELYEDDLKENKLDGIFYDDIFVYSLDTTAKQEIIDAFIKEAGINIFEYITEVEDDAFCDLNLPETLSSTSMKIVGNGSFDSTNIKNIYLPNCTAIGAHAFGRCENLTSANLQNVEDLGSYAFVGCYALRELSLPKVDVYNSGAGFVNACDSLEKLYMPSYKDFDDSPVEGTIYDIFHYMDEPIIYNIKELYIKDNGYKDVNTDMIEEIKQRFPNLKVIDSDTGKVLRDYR